MFKLFQCVLIFLTSVHTYGFDLRLNYNSSSEHKSFDQEKLIVTSEWSDHTKKITKELINNYNFKVKINEQIHDNNTGYELISFIQEMMLDYNGSYSDNDELYSITFTGFTGEEPRSTFRIIGRKWFNRNLFYGSQNFYFDSYYRVESFEHMPHLMKKMIPNSEEIHAVHTYGFDLRLNYSSTFDLIWCDEEMLIVTNEWSTHTKNITQELIFLYNLQKTKNEQIHDNNTGYELISFIEEMVLKNYGPIWFNVKFYSITFTGFVGEQSRSTFRIKGGLSYCRSPDCCGTRMCIWDKYEVDSVEHMKYVLYKMS